MEKQKVWVVTMVAANGNDYGPLVFSFKPNKKIIKEITISTEQNIIETNIFKTSVYEKFDKSILACLKHKG